MFDEQPLHLMIYCCVFDLNNMNDLLHLLSDDYLRDIPCIVYIFRREEHVLIWLFSACEGSHLDLY